MQNGAQVVAWLPYPLLEPKHYVKAMVAIMYFVRLQSVPVPRVLAYSPTNENPVDSEYIIMEKVRGPELGDLWYTMLEAQKFSIILKTVKIEARLFSMNLPASGTIYYQHVFGVIGLISTDYVETEILLDFKKDHGHFKQS